MEFAGYLIKINGTIFPKKYIKYGSYHITPNQILDEDSYTDGDGVLHRKTLPHTRSKAEWETPIVSEADSVIIQNLFPDTTTMTVEYWNPKKHIYESGTFYTPDITFNVMDFDDTDISYDSLRIAPIEY